MADEIVRNYQRIRDEIAEVGGNQVQLMVVSKTWEAEVIRPLIEVGHLIYGENRIQEASNKIPQLPDHLEWHLIGHLQKNKVRKALPLLHTIHSLDSHELARQVDRIAQELGLFPRVFLQVNIGHEPQKHGFSPDDLREAMGEILTLPKLEIVGLMAIPPIAESPEDTRPHFRALRELRDELQEAFEHPMPELSMGMTSDYRVAIEEGSTIVRVGSAIFGPRRPKP